ncbi:MAG: choice-of-anchor L domain-containing protein [Acetivibrionales bacterium]
MRFKKHYLPMLLALLLMICSVFPVSAAPDLTNQREEKGKSSSEAAETEPKLQTLFSASSAEGLVVNSLSETLTPEDLVEQLLGAGVSVSNVSYTGADIAAGTFSNGSGIIGFEEGIILSSGDVNNVIGPNS